MAIRNKAISLLLMILAGFLGGTLAQHSITDSASAGTQTDTLVARSFAIVDAKGNHRGGMGLDKNDNPILLMRDVDGSNRAYLILTDKGPFLGFDDKNGKTRMFLRLENENIPTIGFLDDRGAPQFVLSLRQNQDPGLVLYDSSGHGRLALGLSNGNPGLAFLDSNKQMQLSMQARDGQGALISLQHPGSNRPAAALGVQQGNGFLYALDAQRSGVFAGTQPGRAPALGLMQAGKPLWSATPGGQAPDFQEMERGLDVEALTRGMAR